MKTLLMLGLLLSTFFGGFALHHQFMPCTDQTRTIGTTIDAMLNAVREAWDNRSTP